MTEEEALDALSYESGNFGGPRNVFLNGVSIKAVQSIVVKDSIDNFSEVTIVIGGVKVTKE